MNRKSILSLSGVEFSPTSHADKLVSGLGAFVAIFATYQISHQVLGDDAYLVVASMGAAAVLLFAVPHGPLSQPWPLFGGNLVSALVGVSCAQMIPDLFLAAAAAVGISVTAMYYLKCVHPPGGATALSAVVSGQAVVALGYQYVLTPVLINVMVIFVVAVLFNFAFKWRRYPASLASKVREQESLAGLSHQGIEFALQQIDSFIDVSEEDLNRIFELASEFDRKKASSTKRS